MIIFADCSVIILVDSLRITEWITEWIIFSGLFCDYRVDYLVDCFCGLSWNFSFYFVAKFSALAPVTYLYCHICFVKGTEPRISATGNTLPNFSLTSLHAVTLVIITF